MEPVGRVMVVRKESFTQVILNPNKLTAIKNELSRTWTFGLFKNWLVLRNYFEPLQGAFLFHTAHSAWLFQGGSDRPESKLNCKFYDADADDSKLTNDLPLRETVRCVSCGYHRSDVQAQRPEKSFISLVITFVQCSFTDFFCIYIFVFNLSHHQQDGFNVCVH